jgi:hypothetical protein
MPAMSLEFPKDLSVVEAILDRPGAVTQLDGVNMYVSSKIKETSGQTPRF